MRVLYGLILSVQVSCVLAQVFQFEPSTATWDDANAACAADQFTLIPGRRYRAKKLQNLLTNGQTIWLQGWRGVTDFEKSADGKVKSLKVDISRSVKKGIQFVCESGPGTFFIPEGTAKSLKEASKICVEQQGTLAKFSTENYITKAFDLMRQDIPYWVGNVTTKETIAKLCLAVRMKGNKIFYYYDTCSKQHNYACLKDKAAIDNFHNVVSFKISVYKDFEVEIEDKKALTTSSTVPTTSSTVPTTQSTSTLSSSTIPTTSSAVTNMTSKSSVLPLTSPGLTIMPSHLPTTSSTVPFNSSVQTTTVTRSSAPNTTSLTNSTDTTTHLSTKTMSSFLTLTRESPTPELLLPTVFTRQNTTVTEGVKDAVSTDNITHPYNQKSTVQIQTTSTSAEVSSPAITAITRESTTNSVVSSMKSIEVTSVSTNFTNPKIVEDTTESLSRSSSPYVTDYIEQTTLAFDPDDTQTNTAVTVTTANNDGAGKTEAVQPMENMTMESSSDNKTEYNVDEKMKSVHEGTTDRSHLFTMSIKNTTDLPSEVEAKASTDKTVPDLVISSSTTSTIRDKNTIYNVVDDTIDLSDLDVDKEFLTTDLTFTVETSSTYVTETTERTGSIAPFKPHTSTTSMESERDENIPTYTVLREVSTDTSTTVRIINIDEPDKPNREDTGAPTDGDVSVPGGEKAPIDYEEGNTAESTKEGEREAPNDNWELPLIIAFIIMAVAVLIAILLALYLYRRRKTQQQQEITKESDVELRAKATVNGDKKERETATFKDSAYDV